MCHIGWTGARRASYIRSRHGVEPAWANEALADDHAVWLTPDPASRSGHGVRIIGYSPTAHAVLTVILVEAGADPSEPPRGDWWGSNAWRASESDRHLYGEEDQ